MSKPPKLFVDRTIEVNAPAARVWAVLTERQMTDIWTKEFSSGGPKFHIESGWRLGSDVLWKADDGKVLVEGKVTAFEPNKLLRFTVFDTRSSRPAVTIEDGITFTLEKGKTTELRVKHGDFSVLPEGRKYRDMSAMIWDKVLPEIKALAERRE
ncbi:MAG: hypothetical protein QOG91_681 [Candidatus Parcubacteria bacterium]|jgi:uncharacterized protein YndB with AHSA1/START domain|nr:hypothetical protein [Candidatus Parcubacteria bacterium]